MEVLAGGTSELLLLLLLLAVLLGTVLEEFVITLGLERVSAGGREGLGGGDGEGCESLEESEGDIRTDFACKDCTLVLVLERCSIIRGASFAAEVANSRKSCSSGIPLG